MTLDAQMFVIGHTKETVILINSHLFFFSQSNNIAATQMDIYVFLTKYKLDKPQYEILQNFCRKKIDFEFLLDLHSDETIEIVANELTSKRL